MDKVRREAMEELKPRRPLIRMKPLQLRLLFFSAKNGNLAFLMFSTDKRNPVLRSAIVHRVMSTLSWKASKFLSKSSIVLVFSITLYYTGQTFLLTVENWNEITSDRRMLEFEKNDNK